MRVRGPPPPGFFCSVSWAVCLPADVTHGGVSSASSASVQLGEQLTTGPPSSFDRVVPSEQLRLPF